nr:hypothetical protein [Tanacetum cinerariifolium]
KSIGFEVILLEYEIFECWSYRHTTNGHQFTMSNPHQELTSPEANGFCKELASPKQTTLGKDESNPLIIDSLLKTIWLSMNHVIAMKHWLFQSKWLLIVDFLNRHSIQYAFMVNPTIYVSCIKQFWATVSIKKEIFTKLARMGYKKPPPKLTFYKAFFSAQWKLLIHTLVQCISAKRTAWNEFSCSMASAVIYLATGRKFKFSKYIFDSMYTSHPLTQKVFANMRRVGKGFSGVETPLFAIMLVQPQPPAVEEEDEVKTLIKMKAEKARILDEQMAKRLHDEEIKQAAAREKQEKDDLEKAKVSQKQYVDK